MYVLGYDTQKEGKEPFKKFLAACKVAIMGATVTGGYETIISHPSRNFYSVFVQGGRHLLGWTAITTSFTTAVLVLTNIRKKDDPWNYFFGANVSCAVYYSLSKNGRTAFAFALWTSLGAAILKAAHLKGYDPFDYSDVRHDRYGFGFNFENSPDVRYLKKN